MFLAAVADDTIKYLSGNNLLFPQKDNEGANEGDWEMGNKNIHNMSSTTSISRSR